MAVRGVVGLVVLADLDEYQLGEVEVDELPRTDDANDKRLVPSVYIAEV
jgi:hypothetical protein